MSTTKRAPCPVCDHGPKDTALSITTDERGTVSYCHRCGYTQAENFERRPLIMPTPSTSEKPLEWSERAESIWRRALPLGELARVYLLGRGCMLPPLDGDLRFLPGSDCHPPSLCARISDSATARPLSLHFTPLLPDGSGHGDRRLLAGHRKRGGVIRLWPDEAVTYGLGIAEGIETALAAARIYTPMWAAIDAGNLGILPALNGIDCLAVYADHDDAGIQGATACGQRWRAAGKEVSIYRSHRPGEDIADMLARMDERHAA